MQFDYWLNKWENGDTKFHMDDVNEFLIKYFEHVTPATFFVPLCGKTLDMLWLASKGHKVIGVELSPIACKDFFIENHLKYEVKEIENFILYYNKNIQIWCGDIFKLPKESYKNVNYIYDRAALFALSLDLRLRYVEKLKSIALESKKLQMLLLCIEYQQNLVQAPPFSVYSEDIESYYSDAFDIKQEPVPVNHISFLTKNPKFNGVAVKETVYLLDYKN